MAQRTYNEHFRLYYNSDKQSWAKKPRIEVDIQITENVYIAADIEDLSDIEVKLNYNYCVLKLVFMLQHTLHINNATIQACANSTIIIDYTVNIKSARLHSSQ